MAPNLQAWDFWTILLSCFCSIFHSLTSSAVVALTETESLTFLSLCFCFSLCKHKHCGSSIVVVCLFVWLVEWFGWLEHQEKHFSGATCLLQDKDTTWVTQPIPPLLLQSHMGFWPWCASLHSTAHRIYASYPQKESLLTQEQSKAHTCGKSLPWDTHTAQVHRSISSSSFRARLHTWGDRNVAPASYFLLWRR